MQKWAKSHHHRRYCSVCDVIWEQSNEINQQIYRHHSAFAPAGIAPAMPDIQVRKWLTAWNRRLEKLASAMQFR